MLWRSIGDGQWQPTDELDGHVSVWGEASSSTQKWGNFSLPVSVCSTYFSGEMLHSESSQRRIGLQTWTWRILEDIYQRVCLRPFPSNILKNEKKKHFLQNLKFRRETENVT
jgi:hypothetical protein